LISNAGWPCMSVRSLNVIRGLLTLSRMGTCETNLFGSCVVEWGSFVHHVDSQIFNGRVTNDF
jgi:hypothetical protein